MGRYSLVQRVSGQNETFICCLRAARRSWAGYSDPEQQTTRRAIISLSWPRAMKFSPGRFWAADWFTMRISAVGDAPICVDAETIVRREPERAWVGNPGITLVLGGADGSPGFSPDWHVITCTNWNSSSQGNEQNHPTLLQHTELILDYSRFYS